MHCAATVEVVDLRREGEVEPPNRQRFVAGAPPHGFVRGRSIGDPELDVLFVGAHALERTLICQPPGEELHAGIPLPRRFEPGKFGQRFRGDFVQADFRIEPQRGLQVFRFERTAGQIVEAPTKSFELLRVDRQSGRQGVTAVTHEQVGAFAQRRGQIKAGNAPPRTAPVVAVAAHDDRGPVELLQHPRRDDAHHTDVPEPTGLPR